MIEVKQNRVIFNYDLCRQCGACAAVCPTGALSVTMRADGTHDILVDRDLCIVCGRCSKVCPSHAAAPDEYERRVSDMTFFLAANESASVSEKASSGGIARTIIIESLRSGAVDGLYALGPDDTFPFAEGEFYTREKIPGYDSLPNSVYHTVLQCRNLKKIKNCKKLMLVGTSCQLWALSKALEGKAEEIIKVCIFCKQQKTLGSTRFIAKMAGTAVGNLDDLRVSYRGNGWPGIVKINGKELVYGRAAQLPFGRKLWSVKGCNACSDPFGFSAGADVALMDPWNINNQGKSLTLCCSMTDKGVELITATRGLEVSRRTFGQIRPALDLDDIYRKQQLADWYRGEKVAASTALAARLDRAQRWWLAAFLTALPRLPMICYRALCKLPDWRRIFISYKPR